MAMDKNDKLHLFKKVPKLTDTELLDIEDRIEFVDIQILERQKSAWREMVAVKEAEVWADENDKDANKAAEHAVLSAIPQLKSLKLELKALRVVRAELQKELDSQVSK